MTTTQYYLRADLEASLALNWWNSFIKWTSSYEDEQFEYIYLDQKNLIYCSTHFLIIKLVANHKQKKEERNRN